ncbi:MAG: cyclase family protein [Anaerolineaceae bacterium]|nr:cyclase family protein [Anaerolineaceae bacterium]
MTYIDISLPIQSDLPVWPGDPKTNIIWLSTIDQGSDANVTGFEMSAHSGTHIDAPFHFFQEGATIDMLDLDVMIGQVIVVDVPPNLTFINVKYLNSLDLAGCDRLLLKTRNSLLWEQRGKEFDRNFVGIEPDGAYWLVDKKIKLVGIDYLSIAPYECTYEPHRILLGGGLLVLEGLNLSNVEVGIYKLICLPLNLKGREGAPARAILEIID